MGMLCLTIPFSTSSAPTAGSWRPMILRPSPRKCTWLCTRWTWTSRPPPRISSSFSGVQEGTERLAMLTPDAIKTRTFETLRQMSLHGSQQRPLIVAIEDLHWCDKTSEDYLAWLVESVAGAAILLLVTYRPGYRPPWLDKSYATQMALRHLAPQESVTVVRSAQQHHALPAHLEQM